MINRTNTKLNRAFAFMTILIVAFIFVLICNYYTPKLVDDFSYMYSWLDGERIGGIADIVESMKVHRTVTNGRVIPHGLVQLFLMVPDIVFDLLNSAVFVLELLLITWYAFGLNKNNIKLICISMFCSFGLIWICQPVFGQVNLWLDGSVNYLFGSVIHLVFFIPYFKVLNKAENNDGIVFKLLFVIFGFIAGAYSENGSAAVMAMAGIVIVLGILKKAKIQWHLVVAVMSSLVGYITMVFVPATTQNNRFDFHGLLGNISNCLMAAGDYIPLIGIYIILVMFLLLNKKYDEIKISLIFVFGSAISLFLLVFVSFVSERRTYFSCILMLIADYILVKELMKIEKAKRIIQVCIGVIALVTIAFSAYGFSDIYNNYKQIKANENHIVECRETGELDVEIPDIKPKTKYSAIYELKYIDCFSASTWPNAAMAKYYGVNSIIGKEAEE